MDSAPGESRCYACQVAAAAAQLADDALPGLCPVCRRRSHAVRDRLLHRHVARFDADYFTQKDVGPPVIKPGRRCAACGTCETLYGWTQWRGAADDVEGDAFTFCVNCEALQADLWRRPAMTDAASLIPAAYAGHHQQALAATPSLLIVELMGLVLIAMLLLALLI